MTEAKRDVQAVIFVRGRRGPSFLLIERFDRSLGRFCWRLVKGTVREGEGEVEALLREVKEEVGLERLGPPRPLGSYSFEHGGVRHEVSSFLLEADPSEPVRLAPSDDGRPLRSYRWASPEEALSLLAWEEEREMLRRALGILSPPPEEG
ncbi:hypothetical protein DRO32_04650 [Candidatus Bathyarchaeota archaeon]|nr:MAG: hypothetical protein DRO32_04650 [Candidatus Bathyarchaeota archaeon]